MWKEEIKYKNADLKGNAKSEHKSCLCRSFWWTLKKRVERKWTSKEDPDWR